ncbi:helix-turn-helix transcriptional regulator [Phascolarctobacterium succinatutens]|uniref:helix-turn-helix transcriptional regulator n=1 Tax=Phascolarctobacterium succinatutens TaxID=626940 RepID=UPI0026F10D21|nr:WYL domain-containing protein [Phascolarctobacterium succinatutens]
MAEQNAKYLNKCRLLRVFEYMQNTDEQHPLNITQIIAKLLEDGVCDREPDRKSIMRDLQTIEACGYKLETCENHNDGKYLNYENKPFGCYQLKMLADAVASARFLTAEDAKKLVNKIFQLGTPSDRKFLKEAVICDASLNVALSKTKYNFDKIMEAIRDKKQISFQYNYKFVPNPQQKDLSYEGREYFVSPYYFVPMNDDYYVIGCTGEYKNFSHYRLSRMVNVRVQGKAAMKLTDSTDYKMLTDSGKNICDYLREHINMRYGATQRVSLHCRQKCRLDILARFGNRINMYDCPDDKAYFSTSVDVQSDEGFLGWVAGFDGDVIITGPDNVRAAYREYLQKQLELYNSEAK